MVVSKVSHRSRLTPGLINILAGMFVLQFTTSGCSLFYASHPTPIRSVTAVKQLKDNVTSLTSPEMAGRLTGTAGEKKAVEFLKARLQSFGLEPLPQKNDFVQPFVFFSGVSLGQRNNFEVLAKEKGQRKKWDVGKDWLPVALSRSGSYGKASIVFAGYGIAVPPGEKLQYDSYAGLDVRGKWVMIFGSHPRLDSDDKSNLLANYANVYQKALSAEKRGARGLLVINGEGSPANDDLIPLLPEAIAAESNIGVISVTRSLANSLLSAANTDISALHGTLAKGFVSKGFEIPGRWINAQVDLNIKRLTGNNVVAKIPGKLGCEAVVLGAHYDHLGKGYHPNSLSSPQSTNDVYQGADDNASGVAVVLEAGRIFGDFYKRSKMPFNRNLIFALWSGDELGLLGSRNFQESWQLSGEDAEGKKCPTRIVAYLNLDTVGRLRDNLRIQGIASAPWWKGEIELANRYLEIKLDQSPSLTLPTDALTFAKGDIPSITMFTGGHKEIGSPRDTVQLINWDGLFSILRLTVDTTRNLVEKETQLAKQSPTPTTIAKPEMPLETGEFGPIPGFSESEPQEPKTALKENKVEIVKVGIGDKNTPKVLPNVGAAAEISSPAVKGLRLLDVDPQSLAARAGLEVGDIIVKVNGEEVASVAQYQSLIRELPANQAISLELRRGAALIGRSLKD